MRLFIAILSFIPCILIFFYLAYRKKKTLFKDYTKKTIPFLFGGVLSGIASYWIESYYASQGLDNINSFGVLLLNAFILISATEEFFKIGFFFILYFLLSKKYRSPMINMLMIGLGFATYENFLYSFQYDFLTMLVRLFTALPVHLVAAYIAGDYITKEMARGKYTLLTISLVSFVLASFFHGLYDLFILQTYSDVLTGGALVVLVFTIGYYWHISRKTTTLHAGGLEEE